MGRFSRGSVLLLILFSTVSVVYYSKRCHCYKFQRISYSKRGSKFIPQRTLSESATRSRSTEHAGRQNVRFNRQRKTEKSLGLLGALAEMFCRSQRRVASAPVAPHFPTALFSLFYYKTRLFRSLHRWIDRQFSKCIVQQLIHHNVK